MRLLFLHGGGLTRSMWRLQLDDLKDEFEVSAIDLPGHGDRHRERFSFAAAVAAVEEAVRSNSCELLVGLSLGGYVAMAAAAARPQLAAGLVLSGCSVDYSQLAHRLVAFAGAGLLRLWPTALRGGTGQDSGMQGVDPSRAAAIGRVDYPRGYAEALRAATQIRWRKCLTFYEGPVLILNGEYDKPHVRYQADLLSTVRDGRIEAVKGAGHLANLDRPREFTAAVRSFARTVAGRAPGLL